MDTHATDPALKPDQIKLGGKTFTVSPPSLKSIKKWMTANKEIRVGTLEYMEAITDFIMASLRRAHPDIDQDFVEENLNERNIAALIVLINKVGGLETGEPTTPPSP
jgi:hypothetical protein